MANAVRHGNECLTPVSVQGYPRKTLNNGEWQLEEQFRVNIANVATYIPAKNSTNADGYLLQEVEVTYNEQGGFDNICLVRIVWGESSYAGGGGGTQGGNISYDSNSAIVEHRIEDHPEFAKATESEKEFLKANMPSFIVHTVQFSKTERKMKSSWHPSFSDIVDTVGAMEVPADLSGATASTWLHTGRRITWTQSDKLEQTDEWTYDAYGWQGTIFPTTTLAEMLEKARGKKSSGSSSN